MKRIEVKRGARLLVMTLAFILGLQATAFASQPGDMVDAPDGVYKGISTPDGHRYLGIRYAEPPTGIGRWSAPRPLPVRDMDPIDATEFGSPCIQPQDSSHFVPGSRDPIIGREDCLFLNVYTPASQTKNRAVMVWIHGGGFVTGAGSKYDPHVLAEKNDLIVVTLNYRLGSLGFLSLPSMDASAGNYGAKMG